MQTTHGLVSIPTNLERLQERYAASLLHSHQPLDRGSKGEVSPGNVKCLIKCVLYYYKRTYPEECSHNGLRSLLLYKLLYDGTEFLKPDQALSTVVVRVFGSTLGSPAPSVEPSLPWSVLDAHTAIDQALQKL